MADADAPVYQSVSWGAFDWIGRRPFSHTWDIIRRTYKTCVMSAESGSRVSSRVCVPIEGSLFTEIWADMLLIFIYTWFSCGDAQ